MNNDDDMMSDAYRAKRALKSVCARARGALVSENIHELNQLSLAFGDIIDCSIGLETVKNAFPFRGMAWGPPSLAMHELVDLCDVLQPAGSGRIA